MLKTDRGYWPAAVLLAAQLVVTATASAGESQGSEGSSFSMIVIHPASASTDAFARERSGCKRYGVIWSGGTALRRPDPVSPRPVRSRWQAAGESRIRCTDGGAFRKSRVVDRPWIR